MQMSDVGRAGREARHLLDNAEQNIGNSTILMPQVGPSGPLVPSLSTIPQTNPSRLLALSGPSERGQTTSVVVTAARITGADNPNPGLPGPITGIIEYGSGGRFTRIEFDVPLGPFSGYINQANSAVEPQDGCSIVTVPTSVLRVYARYDNLLIAPVLGTATAADPGGQSLAELQGLTDPNLMGPGGPVLVYNSTTTPPSNVIVPSEPVSVKALAAYFTKPRAKVYKTINCYIADETSSPQAILVQSPASIGGFGNFAFWSLPTGTKNVTILRFSGGGAGAAGLHVMLHDGVRPVDYTTMATGSPALTLDVRGNECILGLNSVDGNAKVTMLKLVCEIGI